MQTTTGWHSMKTLTNQLGSYLTGTDIADAVLRYGLALSRARDVDIVDIPFVDGGGVTRRVEMTVGWCCLIVSVGSDALAEEMIDVAATADMAAKAAHLETPWAEVFTAGENLDLEWMNDDADL